MTTKSTQKMLSFMTCSKNNRKHSEWSIVSSKTMKSTYKCIIQIDLGNEKKRTHTKFTSL